MRITSIYEEVRANSIQSIGKVVKRVTGSTGAYNLLDADPATSGGTFTTGGCAVLAYALSNLIPNSKIFGIRRDGGNGIVDHVVLKVGNNYIDADGVSDESTLLNRWEKLERINNPVLVPIEKSDLGQIPYSQPLIDKFTALFNNYF